MEDSCADICAWIEARIGLMGFDDEYYQELRARWSKIHDSKELHSRMLKFLGEKMALIPKQDMEPTLVKCNCGQDMYILVPVTGHVLMEGDQFTCGRCWDRIEKGIQDVAVEVLRGN